MISLGEIRRYLDVEIIKPFFKKEPSVEVAVTEGVIILLWVYSLLVKIKTAEKIKNKEIVAVLFKKPNLETNGIMKPIAKLTPLSPIYGKNKENGVNIKSKAGSAKIQYQPKVKWKEKYKI